MLLSELDNVPLRYHVNRVYTLLSDIANGAYPSIELFTDKEVETLMKGEDLEDVKSPFWRFSANMEIDTLPLMELRTTKDGVGEVRRPEVMSVRRNGRR